MKKVWMNAVALFGSVVLAGCSSLPNRYDLMGTIGGWSVPENELTLEQRTLFFNNRSADDVLEKAEIIESGDPLYNNIKVIEIV